VGAGGLLRGVNDQPLFIGESEFSLLFDAARFKHTGSGSVNRLFMQFN
jgi:Leu/Phe-tRNA-protein transferase